MGKVIKPLLLAAAVAVNVIPGIGQAIGLAAFSALGTGFVSGALAAVPGALVAFGLTSAANAIKTGARASTALSSTLSRLAMSSDPATPRKVAFGATPPSTDWL